MDVSPSNALSAHPSGLSAEDLIRQYAAAERSRDDQELDKSQREFSVGVRKLPTGLAMVLEKISRDTVEKPSVITKCFSHSVADWYATLPDIPEVVRLYSTVADTCSGSGYADLWKEASGVVGYEHRIPEDVRTMLGATTLKTIVWVNSRLGEIAPAVGTTPGRLLAVGLCRCVCLNRSGWAEGTLEEFLEPEVNNFLWYLRERVLRLRHYSDIASVRIQRDSGKQNTVLFSRKLGNTRITTTG